MRGERRHSRREVRKMDAVDADAMRERYDGGFEVKIGSAPKPVGPPAKISNL